MMWSKKIYFWKKFGENVKAALTNLYKNEGIKELCQTSELQSIQMM